MAVITYVATIGSGRKVTVTRGTGDALGAGVAALLFDSTAGEFDVTKCIEALERAFDLERSKASKISSVSSSGTSLE